ncbi:hypothetical protein LTR37_006336 [Vermiconidia calcicola]|uniref:Uncharacterized protein n=1 Tax=Vermiconidia calcicola TaxID=1690605 RepID=A0ACC3NGN7_9PEZI|nr:hypothetical protein LTR37_006336 [Vermiconidia calcicola]
MPDNDFSHIPAFYRFYFRWSDPAVCLWATYMDFFTPDVVVNAFVPASISARNEYQDFLLQQLGGSTLMLAFLAIVLLRYTSDVKIWKILEAAVLVYDFSLLYSSWYALDYQGRLSVGALRWEDWGGIAITGQAVFVRTAFLLGAGLSKHKMPMQKKK